jgi:hypothetical protein
MTAQTAKVLLDLPAVVQILSTLLHGVWHAATMKIEETGLPASQIINTPRTDMPGGNAVIEVVICEL